MTGLALDKFALSLADREPADRERLLAEVRTWCAGAGVDPDAVVRDWLSYPQLTVRRRLSMEKAAAEANRVMEAFLIANGVNIFGDLVCMTTMPEHLAEQGPKFVGHD